MFKSTLSPVLGALAILFASTTLGCITQTTESEEGIAEDLQGGDDDGEYIGSAEEALKYNYQWVCHQGQVVCADVYPGGYTVWPPGACQNVPGPKPTCSGSK